MESSCTGRTPGTSTPGAAEGTSAHGIADARAAYHPDFHRRSWSFTRSTGRWLRSGRGLLPPVRSYTDPGAREIHYAPGGCLRGRLGDRDLTHEAPLAPHCGNFSQIARLRGIVPAWILPRVPAVSTAC
jgi:hypothetical protein